MKKLIKFILCGCLLCGCTSNEKEPPVVDPVKIVSNEIYEDPKNPNANYTLAYNKLSEDLDKKDYAAVAEDVAICFVYDFFTLSNKTDASDVGGLAYLPKNRAEEFKDYAEKYFYKNYPSLVNEYGQENLPEVKNVIVESKAEVEVEYLGYTYDGYEFTIVAEYNDTSIPKDKLKTNMTISCLVYDGKALLITLK